MVPTAPVKSRTSGTLPLFLRAEGREKPVNLPSVLMFPRLAECHVRLLFDKDGVLCLSCQRSVMAMPLSDLEQEVVLTVVRRFLDEKKPTPHKELLRQCRNPKVIERLVGGVVLNAVAQQPASYLPRVLAFEYCGDAEMLRRAKSASTVVVRILQNLFDTEMEKENFTADDVAQHAAKMYESPPAKEEIALGLFLGAEFANVLKVCGFSLDHTEMTMLQVHDSILALSDIDGLWDKHVREYSVYLEAQLPLATEAVVKAVGGNAQETAARDGGLLVFISHSSKDAALAQALIDLLRAGLGLHANQIRCSSVDGYRLSIGVNSESELREEVNAAKVVIGLITPNSLASYFVMFELGARWGANLFLAPLLAGVQPSELSTPLSFLNALSANNESQLHQLLDNISKKLRLSLEATHSYVRHVSTVKTLADAVPQPTFGRATQPPLKSQYNINFVEATSTTSHLGEPSNSTMHESPQRLGDFQISVIRFRNDVVVGQKVEEPSLTCHIIYRDQDGKEITDVPRGVWLDHYGESVDFELGKKRSVVIFLLAKQGTVKKLWNESYFTSTSWMADGRPSFRIRDEGIRGETASVEISLLSGTSCVLQAIFDLEEREDGKLPTLKLKSTSGNGTATGLEKT